MKNLLFLAVMLPAILVCCQKPENPASYSQPQPLRTYKQVLEKAAEYGIADFYKIEAENNALMYCSEKKLDEYFTDQKKAYEKKRLILSYVEEGKKVQSLSDYFKVLDSYPERIIRIYKSEENYAAIKKEYFASNYKFFINEEGTKFAVPFLMVVKEPDEMPTRKAREIPNR